MAGSYTAIVVLLLIVAGCQAPPDPRRTNFEVRREGVYAKYDPKSGRLTRLDVDTNKNGKIDAFSYRDGTTLLRIEVDRDEDGTIDRWEHYGAGNKLQSVGTSSKGDGIEDIWSYPDAAGLLLKVEFDTDRDGVIDKRDLYSPDPGAPDGRVLTTLELGIDKAGQPERRLHYRPDGTFDRVERLRP